MKIGIVGSEAAKFTPETKLKAEIEIEGLLHDGDIVISGRCHLGGIDIWAVEAAKKLGLKFIEHPPPFFSWEGYKYRNLKIVDDSEKVVCITVKNFPPDYTGMRFPYCYHCKTDSHIKSGGCWTMLQAAKAGKPTQLIVIDPTAFASRHR